MKYRKKPVVVEAIQWRENNWEEVLKFLGDADYYYISDLDGPVVLVIETLEGRINAHPGDYIIRGVAGEYYPCKPDIFEQAYEAVEE